MTLAYRLSRPEDSEESGRGGGGGGGPSASGSSSNRGWKVHNGGDHHIHHECGDSDHKEQKIHRSFRRRVMWMVTAMALLLMSLLMCIYWTVPNPMETLKTILRDAVHENDIVGAKYPDDVVGTLRDVREGRRDTDASISRPPEDHPYPFLIKDRQFISIAELEGCNISFTPPPRRTDEADWRIPMWVPSYPASGASSPTNKGDLVKAMIGLLTGLSDHKPVKNYHMSMRNRLKRCRGLTETVACTQGHPLVPIKAETQTQNFQPHVILPIRNFATAFPASLLDKNIAYHGAKKQNTPEEWKALRDEHLQRSFESWKELIVWWKHADYYNVVLYLPFEDIFRQENAAGPEIVKQLSLVLEQAGFESATSQDDFNCIWYQVYKDEWLRQQSVMDYIPTYTKQQQQWMMEEMKKFQTSDQVSDDPVLVGLLERYMRQIALYTPLDNDG